MSYDKRSYSAGTRIFSRGDRAAEAYLIDAGQVRLFTLQGGEEKQIDVIGKGAIFGEMGVISDMNRMASAEAVSDVTLISCHRQELHSKLDVLDEKMRDAMRFLITYCQDFLPHELMDNRPDTPEIHRRDALAYWLVEYADRPGELDGLDVFLTGLYRVLVSYAARRLPPGFKPEVNPAKPF
ncbi:MAG: Crp/Fnr family transcriptional regulator [Magnetovibrionaceae bacterium]